MEGQEIWELKHHNFLIKVVKHKENLLTNPNVKAKLLASNM